jgi:hypothetical protein
VNRAAVCLALAAAMLFGRTVAAQNEGRLQAQIRLEGDRFHDTCFAMPQVIGCATTILTGQPFHLAVGSIAPQNGFGVGPAFVWHDTPSETWRLSGSVDGIVAPGGAWRTGAYVNLVRTAVATPTLGGASSVIIRPYPVVKLYAQAISLPTISYFGIGPNTSVADQAIFGERETIVGASGIWPVPGALADRLGLSLTGELNGRWVAIRNGSTDTVPSIDQTYSNLTAPGLSTQPATVQVGEGVRIAPSLANGHLRLNYGVRWQQFVAPADRTSSFQRWTIDLRHEIPFFGTSISISRDANTPNQCGESPTNATCPAISHNRSGALTLRALVSQSAVSGSSVVPFYFQYTLGGADLDGDQALPSYADYRFRGPQMVLFQETVEHSLFALVGLWLSADQGNVGNQGTALNFTHLRQSVAVGLSIRGGGLPVASVSWATGGPEGHHIAILVSPSLLGGSSRPALQ